MQNANNAADAAANQALDTNDFEFMLP